MSQMPARSASKWWVAKQTSLHPVWRRARAGSQLIVTGAGNELVFDVENSLFNTQLGGEIVAGDFAVKGVWASGEELELVVDQ